MASQNVLSPAGSVDLNMAREVLSGLESTPKYLPSKYLYNEEGDKLFQRIMETEAYYPSDCEYDILKRHREDIHRSFAADGRPFDLIELGAGDGQKTRVLLEHLVTRKADLIYRPNDISNHILEELKAEIGVELPGVPVHPIRAEYQEVLPHLEQSEGRRKVVLFLGSNIGNFPDGEGLAFLQHLARNLETGDLVMIGFDLRKDPAVIHRAYDDPEGVTRDFNLNLLTRLNHELGADFVIEDFLHYPIYDPLTGEARSHLLSRKEQTITFHALDKYVHFKPWEAIYMECSRKFDRELITGMAESAGFEEVLDLYDAREWFLDVIWRVPESP